MDQLDRPLAYSAPEHAGRVVQAWDTVAAVQTPERVRFRYRVAGPGRRAVAWLLDLTLRSFALLLLGLIVALLGMPLGLARSSMGLIMVLSLLLDWGYGALFETLLSGRTPGKLALGLRVVRTDGAPAQLPDYLLRNLLRMVDMLPATGLVGLCSMLLDDRMRRLGDLAAGTVVVRRDGARLHDRVRIVPPIEAAELRALPPRVDLRPEELSAIEALLRRRSSLSVARVEELAELLAPTIAARTGVVADSSTRLLTLAYARATGRTA